mmetsp:Transcript_11994/g.19687  ORF Transcript_11994/g.19687 Transcript_11994/m.19687 type:complete len:99 (-) Transcript_11994:78-374(-)
MPPFLPLLPITSLPLPIPQLRPMCISSRLDLMYKNSFGVPTCPRKGYGATFADFVRYSLDSNSEGCMDGTVFVQNSEDYVAAQLWGAVSALINFSSTL